MKNKSNQHSLNNNVLKLTHTSNPNSNPKPTRRLKGNNKQQKRKYAKLTKKILNTLKPENNIVTNLSKYNLSVHHLSVLNKGLTFNLTNNKLNIRELQTYITKFERKLQLHYFFSKNGRVTQNDLPKTFEQNPAWWPPKLNATITKYCSEVEKYLYTTMNKKCRKNINKQESNALKELKSNSNIVIKKADKSAGIVIMDKLDYENKIFEMLNDKNTYTETNTDDTLETKDNANTLFQNLYYNDYVTKKQYNNLTNFHPNCPIFYGIPKIHKPNNPLRPIVSQINGPTSRVSKYVDKLLTVAENQIPYLLKDTTAFLNLIENHKQVTPNTLLVTLDVTSLYTNIPQEEGAKLVTEFYTETLNSWNDTHTIKPIPPDYLYELIKFILHNCTFQFQNKFYKQNFGTTMGASFSVKFANIYMHKFVTKFFLENNHYKPQYLARLVDDIFFPWNQNENSLKDLIYKLNNFHNSIKFEPHYSNSEVNFLDTVTYLNKTNYTLHTKLYIKPTHKNQYLHYNSNHPQHVKTAIPYSQALRLRRIIDDNYILDEELKKLKQKFLARNYPENLLNEQIYRTTDINRKNTLQYKTKEEKTKNFNKFTKGGAFLPLIIPFSSTFNQKPTLKHKIIETWKDIILKDDKLNKVFSNSEPQIVYTKGITLQKLLVKSKHKNTNNDLDENDTALINILSSLQRENNNKVYKCNNIKCLCCRTMQTGNQFKNTQTKELHNIHDKMSCYSQNLIYLITCTKCNKQYVGETNRKLKERLQDHKSNIKTFKQTPIAIHFNLPEHNINNLKIIPIEKLHFDSDKERKRREIEWIKKLNTRYPYGINFYPIVKQ